MRHRRHLFRAASCALVLGSSLACSPQTNSSRTGPSGGGTPGSGATGGTGSISGTGATANGGTGNSLNIPPPDEPDAGGCEPSCGDAGGPGCGNGIVDPGESCDDGNVTSGDGCVGTCAAVENGFACPAPGEACISTVVCGDGRLGAGETCDDGNVTAGDGCDASCAVEPGWRCLFAGVKCIAATCGDSIVAGAETCDDGNASGTDGCAADCRRETGWACPASGGACHATVCGDSATEGDEQCDGADNDMGDGCTPFCVNEPDCSGSFCVSRCGDGLRLPGDAEACEDGNTTDGDGCSATCQIESGWVCQDVSSTPTSLTLPIVLRDFNASHPDFEGGGGAETGIVASLLGADGKPVYALGSTGTTSSTSGQANFDQWYRDVPGTNMTVLQTLTLGQIPSGEYQFDSSGFFPLDGLGFNEISGGGLFGGGHNFHFTSEVRYWFEYKGNERLDFTGDDDIWVFVNKRVALDLGGLHSALSGSVTLDAPAATTFGLTVGRVYEIVVFHAERHTDESNYRLTLSGFTNTTSSCASVCGDGVVTADEQCDDAKNDGSYGSCTTDCKRGPHCGDGVVQALSGEQCDNGVNLDQYDVPNGCAPGCVRGGYCGDGQVDSLFGEQCDDGDNNGGYGECASGCVLGPRCGDGVRQAEEEGCDDGNASNQDACSTACEPTILR